MKSKIACVSCFVFALFLFGVVQSSLQSQAAPADAPSISSLGWMAGDWETRGEPEAVEEQQTYPISTL